MATHFKSKGKRSLFDKLFSIEKLSAIGNPIETISQVMDFEIFRSTLEKKLLNTNKKSNADAKPYDVVLMFKIMILQSYYGLSDKQIEYQILNRISFKKILDIETANKIPDEKTVWLFRENITSTGLVEDLFMEFKNHLAPKELIFNEGQLVDASFI